MTKWICGLLAAAFLTGATMAPLMAAPEKKDKKKKRDPAAVFAKLDKDGNSELSVEEFIGKREGDAAEKAKKAFGRKDKDGDGALSLEEFTAGPKKKKKKKKDA